MAKGWTDPWVERAKEEILDVLDDQLAVVEPELVARISERQQYGTDAVQPHVISEALDVLMDEDVVAQYETPTRGGRVVRTIEPVNRRGRGTAIDRAAARKRLLYARYLSWTTPSRDYPQGILGPATEQAAINGIEASHTLQAPPGQAGREVSTFLGHRFDGPVDYLGIFTPASRDAGLGRPHVAIIEVKGNRGWIYEHGSELFQPLVKAMRFQRQHPDVPTVPILICRRTRGLMFRLAQQLGFMAIEMQAQFVGSAVDQRRLDEVRHELALRDIYGGPEPQVSLVLKERFSSQKFFKALPVAAQRWARTASSDEACEAIEEAWRHRSNGARVSRAATKLDRYAQRVASGRLGKSG